MNADLVEKYITGTLTAAEAALLAQAMTENPALAEEFAAATRMESDLTGAFKEDARTALYTRRMQRAAEETEPAAPRRRWWKPAAAAAGVALLSGAGWAWLNTAQKTLTQDKKAPLPGGGTLASVPATDGSAEFSSLRSGGAPAVKRMLRKFVASNGGSAGLRSVPVSQALAALEGQWKNYPHRNPDNKDAVSFAIADTARKLWLDEKDEPAVSLEIPGISLLTSVEVIAAQAGLHAKVTDTGVILEPDPRKDDGKPHTWTLPLAASTFDAFLARARNRQAGTFDQAAVAAMTRNYSPPFDVNNSYGKLGRFAEVTNLSWLEGPSDRLARLNGMDTNHLWGRLVLPANPPLVTARRTGAQAEVTTIVTDLDIELSDAQELGTEYFIAPTTELSMVSAAPNTNIVSGSTSASGVPVQSGDVVVNEVLLSGIDTAPAPDVVVGNDQTASTQNIYTFMLPPMDAGVQNPPALGRIVNWSDFTDYGMVLTAAPAEPPATTFSRLLASHGVSGAEVNWDSENGSLTASGSLQELRAASATLAAVQEAAATGATLRAQVLEWKDGVHPPMERESGLLTATEAAALTKLAAGVLTLPATTAPLGTITRIDAPVEETTITPATGLLPSPSIAGVKGDTLVEDVHITATGLVYKLTTKVTHGDEITVPGGHTSSSAQSAGAEAREVSISLAENDCYRCDFPARGETKAVTVLLRVQAAAVSR